ncbi:MAG: hypothetical protein GY753_07685 [Gammaproteobacteria bacterium]|nr:hypothetical protein [Gammaproteobacteria bacterium]
MPLTLTIPEAISTTIATHKITSFTIDLERNEIHVGYDQQDSDGNVIKEAVLTIDGPGFATSVTRAGTIAGADVYGAIKQALYEDIQSATGKTGAIT